MDIVDDASVQWPYCTVQFDSNHIYGYSGPQYSFGDCGNRYSFVYVALFKLLCQYMLLNLCLGYSSIARILKMFSFLTYCLRKRGRVIIEELRIVTDELGQTEDQAWRRGATADQIQNIVKSFERHSAGTAYISANAAVSDLLWELPPPLGFNIGMGYYEREVYGRMARRMIRAELNILLRNRFIQEAALNARLAHAPRWRKFLHEAASGAWTEQSHRFVNGVKYEDVMLIFLRWRKPSLIPDWERARTANMLEENYLMSCALIIRDFLQGLVAQRKCDELGHHVRELFRLRQWALADRHRVRLSALYTAARAELLSEAEKTETDLAEFFAPPAEIGRAHV